MKNSNNILDLYTRIPDYSQVKHMGNSEFINTLEKLKEDFRQCRASLNEVDSDVEYITSQTNKVLNISKPATATTSRTDYISCSKFNNATTSNKQVNITTATANKAIFCNNYLLPATSNNAVISSSSGSSPSCNNYYRPDNSQEQQQPKNSTYLSIKSCSLHKNPNNIIPSTKMDRTVFSSYSKYESPYAEDYELCSEEEEGLLDNNEDGCSSPESGLSKWSSSPEIYKREKEFEPPANVEKRILIRKSQNNSAPSIPDIETSAAAPFKAHPVPSHVHKPLYEYLMLKNKRRSMRVREASKQKLLAQVKPFSFAQDPKQGKSSRAGQVSERAEELLNNARPTKKRNIVRGGFKTNKFDHHGFRANPAPPRTRALLSAIKLKEQQDYRELKKRLRAEALMKSASLPPSMAARDRRTKAHYMRMEELLARYNTGADSSGGGGGGLFSRRMMRRESSVETWTDDDRLTDEDFFALGPSSSSRRASRPSTSKVATGACSRKLKGNFTPYGTLRFPISSASGEIFESTSNDNHASRLRVQAAKAKELNRIKTEEEELTRQMRMDRKRQQLRDAHVLAWRRAGSYSSSQDIAMRRQLRMATAILERESYRRDMNSMLSRVRSAPLLLEGVREQRPEPCRKHKDELSGRSTNKSPNKLNHSPRFVGRQYDANRPHWSLGREDTEKSETAAMAEGSLTNSDNESVKNPDLEMDDDEQDQDDDDPQDYQQDHQEPQKIHHLNNGSHIRNSEHSNTTPSGDQNPHGDNNNNEDGDDDFEDEIDDEEQFQNCDD